MGAMQDWGDSQAGGLDTAGVMAGSNSSALPSAAHSLLGHHTQPVQDPLQRGEPTMSIHLLCECPPLSLTQGGSTKRQLPPENAPQKF